VTGGSYQDLRDLAFHLFLSHLNKVDHPSVFLVRSCYPLPFTCLFSEHTRPPQCPPSQEKVPGSVRHLCTAMDPALPRQVTPSPATPTPQIQGTQGVSTDPTNHRQHHHGDPASPAPIQTHPFQNMEAAQ